MAKMNKTRKDAQLHVRMSEALKEEIEAAAKNYNLSCSELLLGCFIYQKERCSIAANLKDARSRLMQISVLLSDIKSNGSAISRGLEYSPNIVLSLEAFNVLASLLVEVEGNLNTTPF